MEASDEIVNLVLSMIDEYNEYGDALNFTKSNIDKIVKKYNMNYKQCNELGYIILLKNKYITYEQFCNYMDVEYIDGKVYLVIESFDDILSNKYEYEIEALDGDVDWGDRYYDNYWENDVKSYWSDYTEETLKEIMAFCFKKGIEIEDELMDENNTVLKNGKLFFNDQELDELIDDDEFDELKSELNSAICEAQNSADRDHVYKLIEDAFVDKIGSFERKTVEVMKFNYDKNIKEQVDVEKIYIQLDFDLNEIETFLRDQYNKYNFIDESYGNLMSILKEMEFFDFDTPDYRYNGNGSIDYDYLNEITRERLGWD